MRLAAFLTPIWLAITCFVPHAAAQEVDASHYDGSWMVRFKCPDGSTCTARMMLQDFDGSWQDVKGSRFLKSACGGRKIPLTVQSSKRAHLALTVWGETVAPGCPTLSILVKPVSGKLLEGSYDVGVHESERPEIHASHSKPGRADPAADSTAAKPAVAGSVDSKRAIRLERR